MVLFDCSACPLRCRGGLNGGGGQEGFGIWRASASAAKNRSPSPLTVVSFAVLLPSAPSLSVSNETCKLGASVFFAVASA
ncbi:hypothetical protein J6B78_04620 [Methanocorpusculum sp.]|nr:hypothetical protein [Methanocorpusculum sp.]